MAVRRFTGADLVVEVETAEATMTELTNVVEVRLSDGEAEKVEFVGGPFVAVGHGLRRYWVEVDFEVEAGDTATSGNWYVAKQVDRLDDEPRLVHVYPRGTTASFPYFAMDALFELTILPDALSKNGKAIARLRADPHVASSTEPGWQNAPSAG